VQPDREPAPGWYPDPEDGAHLRYWDGQQWTNNRSPLPTQADGFPESLRWAGPRARAHRNGLLIGWITAILFAPVGLIIGLSLLGTDDRDQAIGIVVLSTCVLALTVAGMVLD
jgi:hypothetical protein